jgi:hypothetical protein
MLDDMNLGPVVQIALAVVGILAALWFYPHCIRPALGLSGARPLAFLIAFGACVLFAVAQSIQVIGLAGLNVGWQGLRAWPTLFLIEMPLMVVMTAAWMRPGWVTRVTGGPDSSVIGRYLMDWASSRWAAARGNEQVEHSTMEMFVGTVSSRGLLTRVLSEADPILDYVAAQAAEADGESEHRRAVEEELASIGPFDPVSWVRVVRRRRALTVHGRLRP